MNAPATICQHDVLLEQNSPYQLALDIFSSQRYLAFYRVNQWWYEAISGNFSEPTVQKIQLILIENTDKTYTLLMPLNTDVQRLNFSILANNVFLSDQNATLNSSASYLSVQSPDPYECFDLAFSKLRGPLKPIKPAPFWDKLGWCTWDAFYKVSA